MVEVMTDAGTRIQIYCVGNTLTAVVLDEFGNVKGNREFGPRELLDLVKR